MGGQASTSDGIAPPPGLKPAGVPVAQPMVAEEDGETDKVMLKSEEESSDLPSVGSAAHSTGDCRPCAWFWKPQGCSNGKDCRHCHLCLEGESKVRKKVKVVMQQLTCVNALPSYPGTVLSQCGFYDPILINIYFAGATYR